MKKIDGKKEQIEAEKLGLAEKSERRIKNVGKPKDVNRQIVYCEFCLMDVAKTEDGKCDECGEKI